jgi:hypothetical protein
MMSAGRPKVPSDARPNISKATLNDSLLLADCRFDDQCVRRVGNAQPFSGRSVREGPCAVAPARGCYGTTWEQFCIWRILSAKLPPIASAY